MKREFNYHEEPKKENLFAKCVLTVGILALLIGLTGSLTTRSAEFTHEKVALGMMFEYIAEIGVLAIFLYPIISSKKYTVKMLTQVISLGLLVFFMFTFGDIVGKLKEGYEEYNLMKNREYRTYEGVVTQANLVESGILTGKKYKQEIILQTNDKIVSFEVNLEKSKEAKLNEDQFYKVELMPISDIFIKGWELNEPSQEP